MDSISGNTNSPRDTSDAPVHAVVRERRASTGGSQLRALRPIRYTDVPEEINRVSRRLIPAMLILGTVLFVGIAVAYQIDPEATVLLLLSLS